MLSVVFGLAAALSFGGSGFFGGISARHMGSLRTVWVTTWTSVFVLALGLLLFTGTWSADAVIFGALSGLCGAIALVFLYASLAIGPMSILSPVGAVVGALVPALWEFFTGVQLAWFAYLSIALILVAVLIVGFTQEKGAVKPTAKGLLFAVLAGTFFGAYYIFLDLAPDDAGLSPIFVNRTVSALLATVALVVVLIAHQARKQQALTTGAQGGSDAQQPAAQIINWRKALPIAAFAGTIEALGSAFVLFGFVAGNLTVTTVLTSLYPAGTIVLATLVLKERLAPLQYVGLALALVAAAGLALA